MIEKAREIAEKVKKAGGRAFFVGGFVRDRLLRELKGADFADEPSDMDIEVHGLEPERLLAILKDCGDPIAVGKSFGIYTLRDYNLDIALPRKERAAGRGHRDFEVDVDPFIGLKAAARRRDFTVNALMEDVLTGEIVDNFGGLKDLEDGVLRCVDEKSFAEDALRVLRAARFASRFNFRLSEDTEFLCRSIDLSALSRERVEGELKSALLKGTKPSLFFEVLRQTSSLEPWFSELYRLIGLEQDPLYHPEGDVWVHTMEVIDRGAAFREKVGNPYGFMLLCLTHDFGKISTTEFVKGRIHAYGHETLGLPLVNGFLSRVVCEKSVREYVGNMVPLHMKPNVAAFAKPAIKKTNKMFDEAKAPLDLIYFSMADKPVLSKDIPYSGDPDFLFRRLAIYEETMAKPFVEGKDLVEAGFAPGEEFREMLDYAHKLRLAGIEKGEALKQVSAYGRKLVKKG